MSQNKNKRLQFLFLKAMVNCLYVAGIFRRRGRMVPQKWATTCWF